MMSILRVGIIGFGRIGAEHAGWLERCPGIRAFAVADVTPARRELARRRGLIAHERFDDLLADPDIDAILISTPTSMHFDQAGAAARRRQAPHGRETDHNKSCPRP